VEALEKQQKGLATTGGAASDEKTRKREKEKVSPLT